MKWGTVDHSPVPPRKLLKQSDSLQKFLGAYKGLFEKGPTKHLGLSQIEKFDFAPKPKQQKPRSIPSFDLGFLLWRHMVFTIRFFYGAAPFFLVFLFLLCYNKGARSGKGM